MTVVLTRSHARELDLDAGSRVWLSPNRGATTMPSATPEPPTRPRPLTREVGQVDPGRSSVDPGPSSG